MTHPTKRRTYSRDQWEAAQRSWRDSGLERFPEWRPFRHQAAMEAGIIAAPSGTVWDSWADDQPSELAVLTRAIRETPDVLRMALRSPGVHSWAAVVAIVTRWRDARLGDIERQEAEWTATKERRPMARIDGTLATIGDSLGVDVRRTR